MECLGNGTESKGTESDHPSASDRGKKESEGRRSDGVRRHHHHHHITIVANDAQCDKVSRPKKRRWRKEAAREIGVVGRKGDVRRRSRGIEGHARAWPNRTGPIIMLETLVDYSHPKSYCNTVDIVMAHCARVRVRTAPN